MNDDEVRPAAHEAPVTSARVPAHATSVKIPGPWSHRNVPTNGAQLHVTLAGPENTDGPLVLLVHGLPQFWFAWRHQVTALAEAGYRVAAVDLRGCGGSDKPPNRHEAYVKARDLVGVIRHLGHQDAVVVAHGMGGAVAWTVPALAPEAVRGMVLLAAPHPVPVHRSPTLLSRRALSELAQAQLPWVPERRITHGDLVHRILHEWSGPVGRARVLENADLYTRVMRLHFAAHSAMEHVRWLVRSTPRLDGRRWLESLSDPVQAPVLSLRGAVDPLLPARVFAGDAAYVAGPHELVTVPDAGHFLAEEAPDAVNDHVLRFLTAL